MSRGLLTEAEKKAIRGDEDDPNRRSTYISRVRGRLDDVAADARLLREHQPELFEQLHRAVCEEEINERVARLEEEVAELREQLEEE